MLPLRIAGSFWKKSADSWECKLVCFIIDANMANKFAPSPDDDVKPVILRLTDPRYESRVANGGKLRHELNKVSEAFSRFLAN